MKSYIRFIYETKYEPDELIAIHNNIARRKGAPQIPFGSYGKHITAKTNSELADKIEAVNKYKKTASSKTGTAKPPVKKPSKSSFKNKIISFLVRQATK